MKKFILAMLCAAVCLLFTGCAPTSCGYTPQVDREIGEEVSDGDDGKEEITEMFIKINGNKAAVTLAENSAVDALVELLKNGDITYTANDYGGFEKVGSLGHTLPRSDEQTRTEPGDVILYQGDQLVLFYGNNSWSYTRIGKIEGYTASELKTFLCGGQGQVIVTLSLK